MNGLTILLQVFIMEGAGFERRASGIGRSNVHYFGRSRQSR